MSDLDFVVYGLDNHRRAIETFKKYRGKEVYIEEVDKHITVQGITNDYWDFVYNKRMSDASLTKKNSDGTKTEKQIEEQSTELYLIF